MNVSPKALKKRYEDGDPAVGLLGLESSKFDFYVLYSTPDSASISTPIIPFGWDDDISDQRSTTSTHKK